MTARFALDELLTLEGARLHGELPADKAQQTFSISTDSRNLGNGDLYLALKGERFDGHSFVPAALSKSALAIIEHGQAPAIIAALQDEGGHGEGYCLLSVPDTLAAYQALAQLPPSTAPACAACTARTWPRRSSAPQFRRRTG